MCEEVQMPEREVPKAMVLSVAAAGITGVIYLIPILFVLPDVSLLLSVANGQPIGLIFQDSYWVTWRRLCIALLDSRHPLLRGSRRLDSCKSLHLCFRT